MPAKRGCHDRRSPEQSHRRAGACGGELLAQAQPQPCPLHHASKSRCREGRAPLADEHERAGLVLPLQPTKRAHFRTAQRMHARAASLAPADVQDRAIAQFRYSPGAAGPRSLPASA